MISKSTVLPETIIKTIIKGYVFTLVDTTTKMHVTYKTVFDKTMDHCTISAKTTGNKYIDIGSFYYSIAFFGALGALWLVGLDNNIYTQVGFVLLFGLASKTAILIVEFAKEQHEEGKSIVEAATFAAKLRFRAVCMTAISFILGVLPLVIAVGAGAASRRALGTAVIGGMLVAGLVGTILIPSFYVLVQGAIEKTGALFSKKS